GNRRFAAKTTISIFKSYSLGFQKAEEVFDWCISTPGLKVATIYALSAENLRRAPGQLKLLLGLYRKNLEDLIDSKKIHNNKVRVNIAGQLSRVRQLASVVDRVHATTANYSRFILNIALSYGGREEIVHAARAAASELPPEKIDERELSKRLYVRSEPDLLVRTSGTQRLSNFLPWQTAYTELYFSPKLWPEFERRDYRAALKHYEKTQRNFGR
ncbi:di-trans,poly-cis-decaprenylcistransferase, partial [Candidatus Micrarchaeota archaeon]|nr:di-trans,poly-cis-decaprenylcistransferase [Candidatus Micrarchaeota archaeon]